MVTWVPPGHFYSPIPDPADLARDAGRIWGDRPVHGVDPHTAAQWALVETIGAHCADIAWGDEPGTTRYGYGNDQFGHGDAALLFCVLRSLAPHRVVEVGSGWSSAAMLDTIPWASFTFIDPNPERLRAVLWPEDDPTVIAERVQDVSLDVFALHRGDVLFIDSSHVSKTGGDVNWLLFEVLPRLARGVWVHFHDVFWPFEYPPEWALEGRAWNEDYLLRAFCAYNERWAIRAWPNYLASLDRPRLEAALPPCARNVGGSLWLERV